MTIKFDRWVVLPHYATGSVMECTQRYMWKAIFANRGYNPSHIFGEFDNQSDAEAHALRLTERNEPFN